MKIYHLADLHFGKSIYGTSMLEDQRYWADRFIEYCENERPQAIVIAGDVYDRSSPGGDAVELLDYFLTQLAQRDLPVFLIAGNHDSGQRLSFGKSMLAKQNIHIAGTIKKELDHVTLKDEYGPVTFWLMPYTYPEQISVVLEDEEIHTYDQGVRKLLDAQPIDRSIRNVILSHQNVTANGTEVERGGSETMVGGVGQIDYSAYDAFDYVALGHIHSSYEVGRPAVRYAGTPLYYHLEETRQKTKGFVKVVLKEKGSEPQIDAVGLKQLHPMLYLNTTKEEVYKTLQNDTNREEYIGIILTDQKVTPEINGYLRQLVESRGSVLMQLISSYTSFSGSAASASAEAVKTKSLEELFTDLYREQSGYDPSDEESRLMAYIGELVRHQDSHEPMSLKDRDKIIEEAIKIGGGKE